MKRKKDKREDAAGILIPAGLLIGIGMGFVYENVPAGTLIGLGLGFLGMAIIQLMRKK